MKVYGTISSGDKTDDTKENIYKPKYDKPQIVKYVNTNQYDNMSEDYTRVSAKINEDGVIENGEYVSFWYKLGNDPWYYREYDQVTLTDTLPKYPVEYEKNEKGEIVLDENGKKIVKTWKTAVFDPKANPGWTLSEDGKTVSKVVKTERSCTIKDGEQHWKAALDLKDQIAKSELKLKFPGCIIDEKEANGVFLKKDLLNTVQADCHPHNPSEGEKDDISEDKLIFTLTTQPVGAGFAKYFSSNGIQRFLKS